MQTKSLSYVVEIARQQSLTSAAKALGISQSALSQFLAAEEKKLGMPLFFSYQNRLYPTSAGLIYVNAAADMIEIKEQTYQKIRFSKATSSKQIRIGISDADALKTVAKAAPLVFGRYPNATVLPVKGTDHWLKNQLHQGELDMAILGYDRTQVPHHDFYQFAKREFYTLVPRDFQLSYPLLESRHEYETIFLEELKNFPFIFPDKDTLERRITDELFASVDYDPKVIYTASDQHVAMELTLAGFGISFLSKRLASQIDSWKGRIFSLVQHPSAFYGVSVKQGSELDEVTNLLIYCILREAGRTEGDFLLYNGEASKLIEWCDRKEKYVWTRNRSNISSQ